MAFRRCAFVLVFALVAHCALATPEVPAVPVAPTVPAVPVAPTVPAVPVAPTIPTFTPIPPIAAPTNTSTAWFQMTFTGQTNPPTTVFVDAARTSIASTALVQPSAVVFGNAQTVTVAGNDALRMDVFINTASQADAQAVVQRVVADTADGVIGTGAGAIAVTNVVNNTPGTPSIAPTPVAPAVPGSPQNRVFVRFSIIVTGIDLGAFSANTAEFRQSVANILGVDVSYVTIIDVDLITFAGKFTTQDVGLRIIFEVSMPNQAAANNAQATLQNSINANGGRIGAYNVRNLMATTSNGNDNAAVRIQAPVLFLALALAFATLLF